MRGITCCQDRKGGWIKTNEWERIVPPPKKIKNRVVGPEGGEEGGS